jgi:hypothetical protein
MEAVPVTIALHRLFCFHGSDEGDSEPYLWTVGFTIDDAPSPTTDSPTLNGAPAFFLSPGSHDNIRGPMGIGTTRKPPTVGGSTPRCSRSC